MSGRAGNQLSPAQKHKIWNFLETDWENLKVFTQAELAAKATKKFGHPVTKQNISTIIRQAELRQDMRLGIPQFNREMAEAMARLLVALVRDTWNVDEFNTEEEQSLAEDLTAVEGFLDGKSDVSGPMESPEVEEARDCQYCGKAFTYQDDDQVYCSPSCQDNAETEAADAEPKAEE